MEMPGDSKEILVWNGINLIFIKAIDVEGYSKTGSLGINLIDLISEHEKE